MNFIRHRSNTPGRQRGAALVVGLLLLAVITLLAISGMNSASVELSMAGNAQNRQRAFQASEAGIEELFREGRFETDPEYSQTTGEKDLGDKAHAKYNSTVEVDLKGSPQPAIWGNSWNAFSTYHYQISSTGEAAGSAGTVHTQGVAVIAPFSDFTGPGPEPLF